MWVLLHYCISVCIYDSVFTSMSLRIRTNAKRLIPPHSVITARGLKVWATHGCHPSINWGQSRCSKCMQKKILLTAHAFVFSLSLPRSSSKSQWILPALSASCSRSAQDESPECPAPTDIPEMFFWRTGDTLSRGTLFNYFAVTTDCSPTQVSDQRPPQKQQSLHPRTSLMAENLYLWKIRL